MALSKSGLHPAHPAPTSAAIGRRMSPSTGPGKTVVAFGKTYNPGQPSPTASRRVSSSGTARRPPPSMARAAPPESQSPGARRTPPARGYSALSARGAGQGTSAVARYDGSAPPDVDESHRQPHQHQYPGYDQPPPAHRGRPEAGHVQHGYGHNGAPQPHRLAPKHSVFPPPARDGVEPPQQPPPQQYQQQYQQHEHQRPPPQQHQQHQPSQQLQHEYPPQQLQPGERPLAGPIRDAGRAAVERFLLCRDHVDLDRGVYRDPSADSPGAPRSAAERRGTNAQCSPGGATGDRWVPRSHRSRPSPATGAAAVRRGDSVDDFDHRVRGGDRASPTDGRCVTFGAPTTLAASPNARPGSPVFVIPDENVRRNVDGPEEVLDQEAEEDRRERLMASSRDASIARSASRDPTDGSLPFRTPEEAYALIEHLRGELARERGLKEKAVAGVRAMEEACNDVVQKMHRRIVALQDETSALQERNVLLETENAALRDAAAKRRDGSDLGRQDRAGHVSTPPKVWRQTVETDRAPEPGTEQRVQAAEAAVRAALGHDGLNASPQFSDDASPPGDAAARPSTRDIDHGAEAAVGNSVARHVVESSSSSSSGFGSFGPSDGDECGVDTDAFFASKPHRLPEPPGSEPCTPADPIASPAMIGARDTETLPEEIAGPAIHPQQQTSPVKGGPVAPPTVAPIMRPLQSEPRAAHATPRARPSYLSTDEEDIDDGRFLSAKATPNPPSDHSPALGASGRSLLSATPLAATGPRASVRDTASPMQQGTSLSPAPHTAPPPIAREILRGIAGGGRSWIDPFDMTSPSPPPDHHPTELPAQSTAPDATDSTATECNIRVASGAALSRDELPTSTDSAALSHDTPDPFGETAVGVEADIASVSPRLEVVDVTPPRPMGTPSSTPSNQPDPLTQPSLQRGAFSCPVPSLGAVTGRSVRSPGAGLNGRGAKAAQRSAGHTPRTAQEKLAALEAQLSLSLQ